ncbi:MAG: hypothetical protein DMF55_03290 [Acidobacteria bacterium]|nr:MAG: hypothetical protein DMF55_03290 [Acidobacteriota bacterium]
MVVIGAGPIGIAAAFELRQRDHEVVVLEADDVGHALMRWGNTRFFSPLGMNVPRGFRRVLGSRMPPDDVLLTGPEMVERVLAPVATSPALAGCVRAHHRVVAVGRAGMLRGDHASHPLRGERRRGSGRFGREPTVDLPRGGWAPGAGRASARRPAGAGSRKVCGATALVSRPPSSPRRAWTFRGHRRARARRIGRRRALHARDLGGALRPTPSGSGGLPRPSSRTTTRRFERQRPRRRSACVPGRPAPDVGRTARSAECRNPRPLLGRGRG